MDELHSNKVFQPKAKVLPQAQVSFIYFSIKLLYIYIFCLFVCLFVCFCFCFFVFIKFIILRKIQKYNHIEITSESISWINNNTFNK